MSIEKGRFSVVYTVFRVIHDILKSKGESNLLVDCMGHVQNKRIRAVGVHIDNPTYMVNQRLCRQGANS